MEVELPGAARSPLRYRISVFFSTEQGEPESLGKEGAKPEKRASAALDGERHFHLYDPRKPWHTAFFSLARGWEVGVARSIEGEEGRTRGPSSPGGRGGQG
ncbi:MAG: hypothetical protein D6795_19220, partial [Deltaproteobacteria bacterium]